jgi:hypothetical protein
MKPENIAIRLEGGIGDHLLANRFSAAIREKHPFGKIHMYSDTEGSAKSAELLFKYFPYIYDSYEVIPTRKDKNHIINSQFGTETYPSDIKNLPKNFLEKFKQSDKFYDLHVDGLKWLDEDFDWYRYFYFFPKPVIDIQNKEDKPFILANLYARPNSYYSLDAKIVENILNKLSDICNVIVTTTEENRFFYDFNTNPLVEIRVADLDEVFSLSSQCKGFIGIDSGIRCMPYYFGKPTFYFTPFCNQYASVSPAHLLRWVIFEKNAFPMDFDINQAIYILNTAITNKAGVLLPYLPSETFNNHIIKRIYE